MELFYYPAPCRERGCAASVVAITDAQASARQRYRCCRCRHHYRQSRRRHQCRRRCRRRSRPLRHRRCRTRNSHPCRRQRRYHHRHERQGHDDSEDHAPIDFVVVVVIRHRRSIFFVFIECRVT